MQTHDRFDVTPKPVEFDAVPSERRVTIPELVVVALCMGALLFTDVTVQDPWLRMAGVLLITGVLSAFVARRVAAARRRP